MYAYENDHFVWELKMSAKIDSYSSISKNTPTERLFIEVTQYDLAKKTGFVSGTNLLTGEEIQIRLNTIDERLQDRPSAQKKTVEAQYSTGAYKRESLEQKHLKKNNMLLMEDAVALKDGTGEVSSHRAHWAKSICAEDDKVKLIHAEAVHLNLKKASAEGGRDSAYIEIVHPSQKASKDNIDEILLAAFDNQDKEGNPARPVVLMDLRFEQGPVFPNLPRIYPAVEKESVYDAATGGMKSIDLPAKAQVSVTTLLDGSREPKDGREAIHFDYFKAAIAAIKNEPLPESNSVSPQIRKNSKVIHDNVSNGKFELRISRVETYSFGPQARKTYLNEADKKHLSGFHVNRKNGEDVRAVAAFTEAVVSLGQFEDGTYFVKDLLATEAYPKTKPINEFDISRSKEPKVLYENKITKASELDAEVNNNSSPTNNDDNTLTF